MQNCSPGEAQKKKGNIPLLSIISTMKDVLYAPGAGCLIDVQVVKHPNIGYAVSMLRKFQYNPEMIY